MKRNLLLNLMLGTFIFNMFSQEIKEISKVPAIRKGEIILNDGTSINFKQLNVLNDTVVFFNSQSIICKYTANDIYKITKTGGNFAVSGAIYSGLGGLLGAISGTRNWNYNEELKDKKSSFIIGATLLSAAIGGIIGTFIKREKTIYKNTSSFSFNPVLSNYQDKNIRLMFICSININ